MISIAKIEIGPVFHQKFLGNESQYETWIQDAVWNSQVFINVGAKELIRIGDLFRTVYRNETLDAKGEVLGTRVEQDHNLIKIIEVQESFSIGRFESFSYELFYNVFLPRRMKKIGEQATFMELYPLELGQELLQISSNEVEDWNAVDSLSGQLTGDHRHTPDSDVALYHKIIRACDGYIKRYHPIGSYFLSSAYFQKGFSLHKLKQFKKSNEIFHKFLELFPGNPSENGARRWIDENNYILSQMPEQMVTLEPVQEKETVKILFLGGNAVAAPLDFGSPQQNSYLRLDKEVREIETQLKIAKQGDSFEFIQKWAITPRDLLQHLLDHEPHIVHFSGHGGEDGIMMEDEAGEPHQVSNEALGDVFKLFSKNINCVVLNSCYSRSQAEAIGAHISNVIGMGDKVPDNTSISFAVGFYKGIGAGRAVGEAFEMGISTVALEGYQGDHIPELISKTT